jgi:hypothetical protein
MFGLLTLSHAHGRQSQHACPVSSRPLSTLCRLRLGSRAVPGVTLHRYAFCFNCIRYAHLLH